MTAVLEKQRTEPELAKPSGKPVNWLAVIAWQVIAILFVELALFCAGLGEEETVKIDPELGCVHLTNKRVTWRSEGHSVSWFDANGMRETGLTIAKPAGTYRIALLGDSMTESLQVNLDKTFGKKLEKMLARDLNQNENQKVQVLNFGCSGYSTVQELLLLRRKVLQYKPDLVLVFYNNRDSFENWSPPDQVIANVRPMAMHLPGGKLVIDSSPVKAWMKSPRAKFLKSIEWLRCNSRIWGFAAAVELDWSLHNDTYRNFVLFVTRPGKALRQWGQQLQAQGRKLYDLAANQLNNLQPGKVNESGKTQVSATRTEGSIDHDRRTAAESNDHPARQPGSVGKSQAIGKQEETGDKTASKASGSQKKLRETSVYVGLIYRTLGSILDAMRSDSAAAGAKFGVVAMPVRSALVVDEGVAPVKNDLDYNAEVEMLQEICVEKKIPFLDCNRKAGSRSADDRKYMFYAVHLTPEGHDFVAGEMYPFLKDLIRQ